MKFYLSVLVLAAVPGLATPQTADPGKSFQVFTLGKPATTRQAPKSGSALIGGGGDSDAAFQFLCGRSGGGDVVVLRASGGDDYNSYIQRLCPGRAINTIIIRATARARDPHVLEIVKNAGVLFIAGGDQSNYVKFWTGTPLPAAINELAAKGVPVGGVSAGLAVLGQYAFSARLDTITTAEALQNPYDPKLTLEREFLTIPYLRGVITDSHFSQRKRMGRTIAFLARIAQDGWALHPRAIGVDERTAVLVDEQGRATVVGEGAAYFLSLENPPENCFPGKPLSLSRVLIFRAESGSTPSFDLKSWAGLQGTTLTARVDAGRLVVEPGTSPMGQ